MTSEQWYWLISIWSLLIVIGGAVWKKNRYKILIIWTNTAIKYADDLNKLKDRWAENMVKEYANSVRRRYPNDLKWWERLLAPILKLRKYIGTTANLISINRILLAVIIILLIMIKSDLTGIASITLDIVIFLIFVAAAWLDFWDGPVARGLGEVSETGKIIDPIADKCLFGAALIPRGALYLSPIYYWILIGQELFLIFITILKMLAKRLPFTMASSANLSGKIKAILEFTGGATLLLCPLLGGVMEMFTRIILIGSIPFAMGSIIGYLSSVKRKEKMV
jgi:CDP-diacylglycerol--glycerol-3-phosphate 3-phosphatidyltransferase